jgi:hypothetical protein
MLAHEIEYAPAMDDLPDFDRLEALAFWAGVKEELLMIDASAKLAETLSGGRFSGPFYQEQREAVLQLIDEGLARFPAGEPN